jgi:phosphoribosylformylglycinamidine synthase
VAAPAGIATRADADPAPALGERFPAGSDLSAELLALLATPGIADASWVWRQYDHHLFLNTVVPPGGDAALLRLKGTERALALTTDGNARFCRVDPRAGAALAVMESARNLSCVGAAPKAVVNCLNFGNPEHPEVMWQFGEAVDGMSDACRALGIPVIGGNVSFYNESRGRDIDPTPIVGVVGLVEHLRTVPPGLGLSPGDELVVFGRTAPELGGSAWAARHGLRDGRPPAADLAAAVVMNEFVRALVNERAVRAVHDCSEGGLAVAVAEMAITGGCGAELELAPELQSSCGAPAIAWFSESASRVVVGLDPSRGDAVLERARDADVPAARIGSAGGDRLVAAGAFAVLLADATTAWRDAIPQLMGRSPVVPSS